MTVRQAPLGPVAEEAEKQRKKASAVVSRAQLARSRGAFERAMAATVLLVSYLGTVLTIAGGVAPLLAAPTRPLPWLGALVVQGGLTALQWWYGNVSRRHPAYLGSLVIDAGATIWGYGPVFAPPIAAAIAAREISEPALAAWAIVGVAALAIAWYPEHILVD